MWKKKNEHVIPLRSQAMGSLELGGFYCKGREKLKVTKGTFSALSLKKQLPDVLHLPGQKPVLKVLQVFAVPPGFAPVSPADRPQA